MSTKLLTPAETAERLKIKVKTLANWRVTGKHGLKATKVGKLVRYFEDSVQALIEQNTLAK